MSQGERFYSASHVGSNRPSEYAHPGCRLDVEPEELVLLAMLVPPDELIGSATQALRTPSEHKLVAGIAWRRPHTVLNCCGNRAR